MPLPSTPQILACDGFLAVARGELGVREAPGDADNPRVQEYQRTTTKAAFYVRDSVAWCSSFANWVTLQAGTAGSGSAAARSWLKWGEPCDEPVSGCIVVFSRVSNPPLPGSGHVGLFVRKLGGLIFVCGGNQRQTVCVLPYPERRLLGYRMPREDQLPPELRARAARLQTTPPPRGVA